MVSICDCIGYWGYLILIISGINGIRYYNIRIRLGMGLDLVLLMGIKTIVLNLCIVAKALEKTC